MKLEDNIYFFLSINISKNEKKILSDFFVLFYEKSKNLTENLTKKIKQN